MKNLIFDWSGTLADDQRFTWMITCDTLEHFGAERVSYATYGREFVIPVSGFYGPRCPGVSMDAIDAYFFARYTERAKEVVLFPGVAPLLTNLARSKRLFVLTTNATAAVERCLEALALTGVFETICGHAFDKREHLPALLSRHQLRPLDTAFFGDTPHDVEAGKASDLSAIAVSFGYGRPEALAAAEPTATLDSVEAMAEWIAHAERTRRPAPTVGGLVFDHEGRALFVRTRKWSNKWGTPGGHVEFGEAMVDAFRREIREETGLEVEDPRLVRTGEALLHPDFHQPRHFLMLDFVARCVDPTSLRLNHELEEARWLSPADAQSLELTQPTRELLRQLAE